jgi:hypothetical protein
MASARAVATEAVPTEPEGVPVRCAIVVRSNITIRRAIIWSAIISSIVVGIIDVPSAVPPAPDVTPSVTAATVPSTPSKASPRSSEATGAASKTASSETAPVPPTASASTSVGLCGTCDCQQNGRDSCSRESSGCFHSIRFGHPLLNIFRAKAVPCPAREGSTE